MAEPALRHEDPLAGSGWSIPGLAFAPVPPASRHVLRLPADAVAAASAAFGLALPLQPCSSARAGSRAVLWLGPDEWLILDDNRSAALPELTGPHALVDVSERQVGLDLSGPLAATVLAHGCPLDLHISRFPVGKCTRTLLGKVEIVLWRTAAEDFRVECWRSFAEYVNSFIALAARRMFR